MRSVVLTGVSRGLGAALFTELAGRGDRVFAIGRHFTDVQRAGADAEPDRIRLYEADLAEPASVPDAGALGDFLRGECVLIHNAGTVEPIGPVGKLPRPAVLAAVAVNLTSPMLLTDAFLAARPAGAVTRVLYVSSGATVRIIESWAAYSATKRGAEMFFDVVAAQEPDAYVVNVNPGVMDTDMQAVLRDSDFPERDRYAGLHERGELPDPTEIAHRIIAEHIDRPVTT
jgi:NAD(P)-dependent dehydrogenase (short-subunit alcohol dehydrogenase family)